MAASNKELSQDEQSFHKIRAICRASRLLFSAIFVILLVYWLVSTTMLFSTVFSHGASEFDYFKIALCIAYGVVVSTMFIVFVGLFSDVVKGNSPFTMLQVKRLRIIASVLLIYALLDAVMTNAPMLLQANGVLAGYAPMGGNAIVAFNFAPLVAAAVVFAFSFVFKYGVLLQEFSDETL